MNFINWLNENIVWGVPMLSLFLLTGFVSSYKIGFSQFNLIKLLKKTLFAPKSKNEGNNLSPFQTLTSTLAVTLGTGNIVALGTAIALGGAGAVFWMWVSAFLGMATAYCENYFGILTRKKNKDGSYFGGAFLYIEKAMSKGFGVFFALCCLLSAFGMGNMTQINAMSNSLNRTFGTPLWASGVTAAILVGITVFGGAKFIGEITEKVIPFISAVYIIGCGIVIALNFSEIPSVFHYIFKEAFNFQAVSGGFLGSAMIKGMNWGLRRGVFSNEAGLGTTVILNSMSDEKSPDKQSSWAMLCVFIDTIVICTLTALVILLTGADKMGMDGTQFAALAFGSAFGSYADGFITVCIAVFALATAAGWSVFGSASLKYLLPNRGQILFLILYIACCFLGAIMDLETVWSVSDLLNGLMAFPNLIALNILFFLHNTQFSRK